MTLDQPWLQLARRRLAGLRSPRALLRAGVLVGLMVLWIALGMQVFGTPTVDSVSQYDLVIIHAAGREALTGGDPYSPEFIASLHADPHGTAYAYPLASLWVLLPFLPLPLPLAATLWVTVSMCGLVGLAPLLGNSAPSWIWLAPLLYYPSLYALKIVQWAPIQMLIFGVSLWLWRRNRSFLAGLILPLATVKPTTGLGFVLLAGAVAYRDKRWWQGLVAGGLLWYGTPFLLQPDWPLRWLRTLQSYADPSAGQFLVTLTDLPDGRVCAAAAVAAALWCLWQRRITGFGCALLVLATLATPHRAQYDYPVFWVPLLFLERKHRWAVAAALVASWLFPLTFELGWGSSLQISLFIVIPSIIACVLASDRWFAATAEQPALAPGRTG